MFCDISRIGMRITSVNYNGNYNNSRISHTGGFSVLNKFNPISVYSDKYFFRVASLSTDWFEPESKLLRGKIKEVFFKDISAWDINPESSEKYILFLHGMAQNVSNYQHLYEMILNKKAGVFALEYRGYGRNGNAKVTEGNLKKDVENGYNYLIKEKGIKPENIIVVGHSMGGALAANLVSKHPQINSLVLVCPITQMTNLGTKFTFHKRLGLGVPSFVDKITNYIRPLKWLYNQRFNSLKKIKKINTPIYYVQSKDDSVTTLAGARKFVKKARSKGVLKDFKNLPKGGHKVDSEKIRVISDFLEQIYK